MPSAILRAMTAVEGPAAPEAPVAPVEPTEEASRPVALPALCPYLATPSGAWRSAHAVREHHCTAVSPPVPLALEKQRRLCLVAAHETCATYEAAQASLASARVRRVRVSRPIARMTPVILDQRRFDLRLPNLRGDRAPGQAVLVGILGLAFVAILLARQPGDGGANQPGAGSSTSAAATAAPAIDDAAASPPSPPRSTPTPEATQAPAESAPASSPPGTARPTASSVSGPSPAPSTSGATYKVKSGDTLSAIAARFGTTTRVLINLNGLADPSKLKIGQIIKLP